MHIWLIELSLDLLFYNAKLHVHKGEGNKFLDGNLHRLSKKDNLDVVMNERLTPLLSYVVMRKVNQCNKASY